MAIYRDSCLAFGASLPKKLKIRIIDRNRSWSQGGGILAKLNSIFTGSWTGACIFYQRKKPLRYTYGSSFEK